MPKSMVGLLATVGTAMSAVAGLAHGDLFWAAVVDAAAATGLAAYLALPPTKKTYPPWYLQVLTLCNLRCVGNRPCPENERRCCGRQLLRPVASTPTCQDDRDTLRAAFTYAVTEYETDRPQCRNAGQTLVRENPQGQSMVSDRSLQVPGVRSDRSGSALRRLRADARFGLASG
jgi:hypothetical protein